MNNKMNDLMKKKRKTVIQISDDNRIIPITTKELKEIDLFIKHPSNQTKLDDDKIKEMCAIYNEDSPYKKFFLSCALITIAKLVVGDKICKQKSKFAKNKITCIENKSCMFMKNNNFFEWLIDLSVKPYHDYKKRISISKELQEKIWQEEFGACTSGKCTIFCCQNILSKNISNSWQCGRIISCKNSRNTYISLSNLRPLCKPCYDMMNDNNWDDYEKFKSNQYIIDEYYEDELKIIYSYLNNPPENLIYKNNIKISIILNENYTLSINVQNQLIMSIEINNENEMNDYLISYNNKTENVKELINLFNEYNKQLYNYYKKRVLQEKIWQQKYNLITSENYKPINNQMIKIKDIIINKLYK